MEKEVWMPVNIKPGFDLYEVSNMGRVRSINGQHQKKTNSGKILKPFHERNGYVRVRLYDRADKKTRSQYVHRLVLYSFGQPPLNGDYDVHHIDGNKANNHLSNLQWAKRSDNVKEAYSRNKKEIKQKILKNRLTFKDVEKIRKLYKTGNHSYYSLSDMFGVSYQHIGTIIRGETW